MRPRKKKTFASNQHLLDDNEREEKDIKKLAKLLGLRQKRKLPKSFENDGLYDIISFTETVSTSKFVEQNALDEDPDESPCITKRGKKALNTNSSKKDLPTCSESDLSDPNDNFITDSTSSKRRVTWADEPQLHHKDAVSDAPDSNKIEEAKPCFTSGEKYIPPAKRLLLTDSCEGKLESEQITRQLKGLINRITATNWLRVCSDVESLFRNYSRARVTDALVDLLINLSSNSSQLSDKMLSELASLLTALHYRVALDVGACFLQKWAVTFDNAYRELDSSPDEFSNHVLHNLTTFVSFLFCYDLTHSLLIYDLLEMLASRFRPLDIELILIIFRLCGLQLRKSDPCKLKNVINLVQTRASETGTGSEAQSSRIRFMLDLIAGVRHNNFKKIPGFNKQLLDDIRCQLQPIVKASSETLFRISYDDLLHADEKGRWWITGASWSESSTLNVGVDRPHKNTSECADSQKDLVLAESNDLIALGRRHMNTDLRRQIFSAIFSSSDYADAFERLIKLKLTKGQDKEIIHVCVQCLLKERAYNPFYAALICRFCTYHRRFRMALQCHLWDCFGQISDMKLFKLNNLARCLAFVLQRRVLSLAVLKRLDLGSVDSTMVDFLKQLFLLLFTTCDQKTIEELFSTVGQMAKYKLLCQSLQLFLHCFAGQNELMFDFVRNQVNLADHCLKQYLCI